MATNGVGIRQGLLHKSKYVAQKLFDSKENYVTCFWQKNNYPGTFI